MEISPSSDAILEDKNFIYIRHSNLLEITVIENRHFDPFYGIKNVSVQTIANNIHDEWLVQ